ncbi:hypothetical protein [Pseudophaeobacter sp.]|uniref:hypothetical protein n=1 Tax=Pseudophaeobacter sp. TaxID=1971739 RepID=UPI003A986F23
MKRNYLAAFVGCLISLAPLMAQAGPFKQIRSQNEFVDRIVDKSLTAEWGKMVIHSDGKISGTVGSQKMVGAWNWQGKYWCRNVRIGKQEERGTDCQKISVDGNQVEFIRDKGRGEPGVLTIGN